MINNNSTTIVSENPDIRELISLPYVKAPRDLPLIGVNQFCNRHGFVYFRLGQDGLRVTGSTPEEFRKLGLVEVKMVGLYEQMGIIPRPGYSVVGKD